MSALDALLAEHPPEPETAVTAVVTVRRHRHQWLEYADHDGAVCAWCNKPKDEARSRRGKSSRRLGHDQERRAEKRYGWEKIGERGEKTDLRGRFAKVQQKASRKSPPVLFRDVFTGLDATRDGRIALLLLSYVRQGLPTEDYIVIRGADWLALHGIDTPEAA